MYLFLIIRLIESYSYEYKVIIYTVFVLPITRFIRSDTILYQPPSKIIICLSWKKSINTVWNIQSHLVNTTNTMPNVLYYIYVYIVSKTMNLMYWYRSIMLKVVMGNYTINDYTPGGGYTWLIFMAHTHTHTHIHLESSSSI